MSKLSSIVGHPFGVQELPDGIGENPTHWTLVSETLVGKNEMKARIKESKLAPVGSRREYEPSSDPSCQPQGFDY